MKRKYQQDRTLFTHVRHPVEAGRIIQLTSSPAFMSSADTLMGLPILFGRFQGDSRVLTKHCAGRAECEILTIAHQTVAIVVRACIHRALYCWVMDPGEPEVQETIPLWAEAGHIPLAPYFLDQKGELYVCPLAVGEAALKLVDFMNRERLRDLDFRAAATSYISSGLFRMTSSPSDFGLKRFRNVSACIVRPDSKRAQVPAS